MEAGGVSGAAGALRRALAALPHVELCERPSPLRRAPRLSARLGVDVWLKRDDLLGPALGGNKVRKLERLLGEALAEGADCVITCGAAQSNHARLTAACARLVGLEPYLVLRSLDEPAEQGNLLLDGLLGAHVEVVPVALSSQLWPAAERLAERLRLAGRRPYLIPVGGSVPLGAAAYAEALLELDAQAREIGLDPGAVYHASSSGGTQAGLAVGAATLAADGRAWRVVGVDVDGEPEEIERTVASLARETAALLAKHSKDSLPALPDPGDSVRVLAGHAGAGYGIVSDAGRDAIRLLARTEGVFVDPVYSGKALAALVGEVRAERIAPGSSVVFWHTGGAPALFAYARELG